MERATVYNEEEEILPKVIGYTRVSTEEQSTESQELTIRRYASSKNLTMSDFISEVVSSRKEDRMIYPLLERLEKNDVLLVTKLDRLGRGTFDVLKIIDRIKAKGVKLIIIDDNITVDADNTSAISQMTLTILGAFSQLERDFISERTKSALKAKKEQGVMLGRPKGAIVKSKYDIHRLEIEKQLALGVSLNQVIRNLKIGSVASLSAWVKSRGINVQ